MIRAGQASISGSRWTVEGIEPSARVTVAPTGISVIGIEANPLGGSAAGNRIFIPAADLVAGFSIILPFRRRIWSRTIALLAALAPAGVNYEGDIVRVTLGNAAGSVVELGWRRDEPVSKGQSRAIEEWTSTMSKWSPIWACHEGAFEVFWCAVAGRTLSRRRLRRLILTMQGTHDPQAEPPSDLVLSM